MELIIKIRNTLISWKYRHILKPILFQFDPELIHNLFIKIGQILGSHNATHWLIKTLFSYQNDALKQTFWGLEFNNPVGLAAGFDKNGLITKILPAVGFGFVEIGSVTGEPCVGNHGKRLWRLPKSKSLIVYYGLLNNGGEEIAERLKTQLLNNTPHLPIGVSLAKTNNQTIITTENGIADYIKAYQAFLKTKVGDYFTINISCPNTFGGEPFVAPEKLEQLLREFSLVRDQRPLLIKLPPDLSEENLDKIIELSKKYKINGFISTNLTKDRNNPLIKYKIKDSLPTDKGGLSGKIVDELATKQISYIYKKLNPTTGGLPKSERPIIIGCGGIFTAQDAYKKIKAGASLLQLITGMIFEGPQVISEINQGLVELLKKDGYKNISEAVGKELR